MSRYNERGFLFDMYGRVKEWRCPQCGDTFGASLETWPKCTVGLWNLRYKHLKACGVEPKNELKGERR